MTMDGLEMGGMVSGWDESLHSPKIAHLSEEKLSK